MRTIQLTDKAYNALTELGLNMPDIEGVEGVKGVTKWKPKGGQYTLFIDGTIYSTASSELYKMAGSERPIEADAQLARDRMIRVNRLSALACELSGEQEFIYEKSNWYIFKLDNNTWSYSNSNSIYYPERVYMTEKCALKICDMLNSSKVELDWK